MKYFAIVPKGAERLFLEELEEFGIRGEEHNELVVFETENIAEIAYKSLLAKKFCQLLDISDYPVKKINFSLSGETFGVRVHHTINKDLLKQEEESVIGSLINEKTEKKVDLETPDNWIIAFINDKKCYLGIDITCVEHDKRPYRVFNNPQGIKGIIAASALYFSGYRGEEVLVDPFCRSGEIIIEAALIASKSSPWKYKNEFCKIEPIEIVPFNIKAKLYSYDEMLPNINAAKKNAKLAGVEKSINFSRIDPSWLDTKHDKETVDLIVTQPPIISPQNKKAKKHVEELFYQASYVLKKEGSLVLATIMGLEHFEIAKKHGIKLIEKMVVYSGKQAFNLFKFHKN